MNVKTKIVAALTLAVLVVPGISMAQTTSVAQLQAEIASLTAQLQSLETQLAAAGGSTAWCYTFNSNLSIGMSGNAITELQTALQKDGESVNITGNFDDQTASAVTAFQEKYQSQILSPYGLSYGTGYAGKSTRSQLNSLFGCNGTTSPNPIPVQPVGPAPIAHPITIPITVTFNASANTVTSGGFITLSWTGSQNAGMNDIKATTCISGITIYDITNSQNFPCGVERSIVIPGSDIIQLTNTSSTPIPVTFQLDSSNNGMPLIQTITVNPATGTPSSINGGTLSVSQGVAATSLAPGGTTQIVGAYNISNSQDGPVTLNTLKFQAGANASFFQNLRVYVNGVQFGSIISAPSNAGSYVFSGSASLGGPDNNNNVQVVADVLSAASAAAQNTTSLSSCLAMPTGNPTYNGQTTTYGCNGITGQTMTFGSSASNSTLVAGRDAERIADIHETQNALELYYNKCSFFPGATNCGASAPTSWSALMSALMSSNIGMSTSVNDPLEGSATYVYGTNGNGSGYTLEATLENAADLPSGYVPPTIPAGTVWTSSVPPTCIGVQYCVTL